jgi:hypothetical protein
MFFAPEDLILDEATSLLADLYALYEFDVYAIFDEHPRNVFNGMASHIDERLGRRMLILASLARANDDAGGGLRDHAKRKREGVGTLNDGQTVTNLTAREACNKIIHSNGSRLFPQRTSKHPIYQELLDKDFPRMPKRKYLKPILSLVGTQTDGRKWHATIDLVQWVHALVHWAATWPSPKDRIEWKDVPPPLKRLAASGRAKRKLIKQPG